MKHRYSRKSFYNVILIAILLTIGTTPPMVRLSFADQQNSRWTGVYVDGFPGWPRNPAALDDFSSLAGRTPAVVMYYTDWQHDAFTTDAAESIRLRGATPMITWLPSGDDPTQYALMSIINGAHDDYIHTFAQQAKAWAHPFYLRFAHEMNGTWYTWSAGENGNTPEQYVEAWRHIHDIFAAEGVNQFAIWVWSPNIDVGMPYTPIGMDKFYPGDQYVDWVGMDGYNWGYDPDWQSFSDIFDRSYRSLTSLTGKPILIGEMASADNDEAQIIGKDKGAWIRDAYLNAIPHNYPRIQGVIWFHERKERQWQVDSSQNALAAYREVIASPEWTSATPTNVRSGATVESFARAR